MPPHSSYLPPIHEHPGKSYIPPKETLLNTDQVLIGNESRLSEYSPPTKGYIPPIDHHATHYEAPNSDYIPGDEFFPPNLDYLPPKELGTGRPRDEVVEVIETIETDIVPLDVSIS